MSGEVSARYVPLAATAWPSFFAFALTCKAAVPPTAATCSARPFVLVTGLRIFVDLLLIAICGGLLCAALRDHQSRSDEAARARTIAHELVDALFMTAAAAVPALLLCQASAHRICG